MCTLCHDCYINRRMTEEEEPTESVQQETINEDNEGEEEEEEEYEVERIIRYTSLTKRWLSLT